MIRDDIGRAVSVALQKIVPEEAREIPFVIERPANMAHGDFACNVAMVVYGTLQDFIKKEDNLQKRKQVQWNQSGDYSWKNPRELAEVFKRELEGKIKGVEKISVEGPGFINFFLSYQALIRAKLDIPQFNAGKTVMVEYTDPNPFKEFHIGHLMSNAIGESVAHLLESTGAKVLRANYQGDVGPHVAKALWGKMHKPNMSWGEAYAYGAAQYELHKDEIDLINKRVYDRSDKNINALYDKGRKESLEYFERLYRLLGTRFSEGCYFFESETAPIGLDLVKKHPELFEKSEGAIVYKGEHTRVFITSQGLPTYEAKDLGLLQLKQQKMHLDSSITITANEQKDYFKIILDVAKKISEVADIASKTKHISHGIMRFESGKMSSRTGNVISGESLVEEMTQKSEEKAISRKKLKVLQTEVRSLKEENKKTLFNFLALVSFGKAEDKSKSKFREQNTKTVSFTRQVGIGAIKYTILKQGSGKDIIFDPEKSLSLDGDSGPYLQYALVRARSLLRKVAEAQKVYEMPADLMKDGPEIVELRRLYRTLIHYPEVVERAAREMEPHYLTTYLTELAGAFNSWYATDRVIVDGQVLPDRLTLTQSIEHVLREGLTALGIPTPEEM